MIVSQPRSRMTIPATQVGITVTSTGIGRSRLMRCSGRLTAADQARSVDSWSRSPSIQRRSGRSSG